MGAGRKERGRFFPLPLPPSLRPSSRPTAPHPPSPHLSLPPPRQFRDCIRPGTACIDHDVRSYTLAAVNGQVESPIAILANGFNFSAVPYPRSLGCCRLPISGKEGVNVDDSIALRPNSAVEIRFL